MLKLVPHVQSQIQNITNCESKKNGTLTWISSHCMCQVHGVNSGCWEDDLIKIEVENISSNDMT